LVVIALRIFLSQVLGEDIMPCGGQAVAAHATVVAVLVGSLPRRAKADDDITRADVGIVDDVAALHAAGDGAVNDDGAHQVAHVGRLSACRPDADAHRAQLLQQLVSTIDNGRDDLAGNEQLVAPDGRADKDVVRGTHTQQVVGVHHDGVLGDAFPHAQVTGLLPVHVGQGRLRAGTVGVHDVAVGRVAAQYVGYNLAEGLWIEALVNVFDGSVDIFLGG